MEKQILVDGKEVGLKITASFPIRYKKQFGEDILKTIMPMIKSLLPLMTVAPISQKQDSIGDYLVDEHLQEVIDLMDHLDLEKLFNIIWILAKTADDKIPEPMEWLDGFNEFPLMDILPVVMEMIMATFGSTQESKKK